MNVGRPSKGADVTGSHYRGETYGKGGLVRRRGQWSLSSEEQPIPTDLEDHIAWVLDKIEPVREQFLTLHTPDVLVDVFCFLDCYGAGGLELSPQVMGRLAALNLPLGLDIYWADEEGRR